MQVTSICSKCQNEIEHGKENYLQLIDRNNTTYRVLKKLNIMHLKSLKTLLGNLLKKDIKSLKKN